MVQHFQVLQWPGKTGGCVPCRHVYSCLVRLHRGRRSLHSAATIYSNVYLNKGLQAKVDKMVELIKDYDLDGFIMFSVRSCKRYSLGQLVSKELVTRETGVPGVVIEGDMVDSRLFNEAQIQTRIDALLEMFK